MDEKNSLEEIKNGVSIVTDIVNVVKDCPETKEAAKNLGKTAVTISKTVNNVLLPLAAMNFACDKAKNYFQKTFQKDLLDKTSSIPQEDLVTPKAYIAGPTLQGIAYTHEEKDLKNMFLNLLSTSMNKKYADNAHPAFVEIIKQMTPLEANLVKTILKDHIPQPAVEIRRLNKNSTFTTLMSHLIPFSDSNNIDFAPSNLSAMANNWIRLGLIEINYSIELNESAYSWIPKRTEIINFKQKHEADGSKVEISRGTVFKTAFGLQFAKAVGIYKE